MIRRSFLLSSAAVALMLGLPTLATAGPIATAVSTKPFPSTLEIRWLEMIEGVFDTLEQYSFGLIGQARLFGADPDKVQTFAELRDFVHDRAIGNNTDRIWDRIGDLMSIRLHLNWKFGKSNISNHLHWLGAEEPILGFSCRDMLETGGRADLRQVTHYAVHNLV